MARTATKNNDVQEAVVSLPATNDLFAGYSDEEKAELLALTGQVANLKADKVPVLKVNYCDIEDKDGNTVKKGNFVFNQNSKEFTDGDDIRVEAIGDDLGKTPEITILAYRQQYAYYNDDAKQRCASQIFGSGEVPVGSTLKYECRSGKCPRRAEGIDRKDKCSCQYVVMAKVEVDGVSKPAMMYVKGKSYSTFSDYLKAAGTYPLMFAPTKLANKMEKQGSVTYFVTNFELLKDKPFSNQVGRENMQTAKEAIGTLEDAKKANFQKAAVAQVVDKTAGSKATVVSSDSYTDIDDDITFD
jgi:hypothetical protein